MRGIMLWGPVLIIPLARAAAEPSAESEDLAREAAARAEYRECEGRLRPTAQSHWELGVWCEQHGLEVEARLHFGEVIRLDPSREAAWKRLGFKRVDGRWMDAEQIAAARAQEAANKVWGPRLSRLHDRLHDDRHRAEALDELARIDEPAAVPSVWNVFTRHGAADQLLAVQVLGQIASAEAAELLTALGVYGRDEPVRRAAVETLRHRDPDDYAPALIGLMRPLLSYESRPVAGPGGWGELIVSYGGATLRRVYAAPGVPVPRLPSGGGFLGRVLRAEFSDQERDPLRRIASLRMLPEVREAYRKNLREAQRAVTAANRQLAADVAGLEALNAVLRASNERIALILSNATGRNLPADPKAWRTWLDEQAGRTAPSERKSGPTVTQYLPLAYVPQYITKLQFR